MTHILKIFMLVSLVLLASCSTTNVNTNEQNLVTQSGGTISEVGDTDPVLNQDMGMYGEVLTFNEIITNIQEAYKTNTQFLSCAGASLDSCVNEINYADGKTPNCEDFLLEQNKIMCKENILILQAKESKDMSLCKTLTTNVENCSYEVAVSMGLESYDTSVCDAIPDTYKVLCHNQIVYAQARETLDASICETVIPYDETDNFEKSFCEEEIKFLIEMDEMEKNQQMEEEISANLQNTLDGDANISK